MTILNTTMDFLKDEIEKLSQEDQLQVFRIVRYHNLEYVEGPSSTVTIDLSRASTDCQNDITKFLSNRRKDSNALIFKGFATTEGQLLAKRVEKSITQNPSQPIEERFRDDQRSSETDDAYLARCVPKQATIFQKRIRTKLRKLKKTTRTSRKGNDDTLNDDKDQDLSLDALNDEDGDNLYVITDTEDDFENDDTMITENDETEPKMDYEDTDDIDTSSIRDLGDTVNIDEDIAITDDKLVGLVFPENTDIKERR